MKVGELKLILARYEDDVEVCIWDDEDDGRGNEIAGTFLDTLRDEARGVTVQGLFLDTGQELPPL